MLLTLSAGSFRKIIGRNGRAGMTVLELPAFTIQKLKLHGLNIPVSLLSGWSMEQLERLRDAADKASCPCLVLIEDTPLPMGGTDPSSRKAAADRVRRLAVAANRLGCNSLALRCDAPDTQLGFDTFVAEMKSLMPSIERQELNALLCPSPGLMRTTQRLTDVIKRVGGFRIGSLPTFGDAAELGDGNPIEALRKLAPYAGSIHATIVGFNKKGAHAPYDLTECVEAIRNVGFLNTLAIEYVGDSEDVVSNIEAAREMLQAAIGEEKA